METAVYKKNMQLLKGCHPSLYQKLSDLSDGLNSEFSVVTIKDCQYPVLAFRNQVLEDPRDPFNGTAGEWAQMEQRDPALLIHMGFGLGYSLLWYLRTVSRQAKGIFVYEKHLDVLDLAFHAVDLSEVIQAKNVCFCTEAESGRVRSAFKNFLVEKELLSLVTRAGVFGTRREWELDSEGTKEVLSALFETMGLLRFNLGNDIEDDFVGFKDTLDNAENIAHGYRVRPLVKAFQGVPGVVISAGPSLKKNIHLVEKLKGKCLLFAVDRIVPLLVRKGIIPEFVVAMEREPMVAEFLKDLPRLDDTYLLTHPLVLRQTIDVYNGPVAFVKAGHSYYQWLPQENAVFLGKTNVGAFAFGFAEAFGCNPIVLLGQDLAFDSASGARYVSDAAREAGNASATRTELERTWGRLFDVKANAGGTVVTSESYLRFRNEFETDIAKAKSVNSGLRVMNATEGGAFIDGTDVRTLQGVLDDVIGDRPSEVFSSRIRELLENDKAADNRDFLADLEARAREAIPVFEELYETFQKGKVLIEDNREVIMRPNQSVRRLHELLDRVIKLKARMLDEAHPFGRYFYAVMGGYFSNFEITLNAMPSSYHDDVSLKRDVILKHEAYFTDVCVYAQKAIAALQEFISRPKRDRRKYVRPDGV